MSKTIDFKDIQDAYDETFEVEKTSQRNKLSMKYGQKEHVRNQRRQVAKRKGRIA